MAGEQALKSRREGDVLVVTFSGLYTAAAHTAVRALVFDAVEDEPARAVVLNLLGAIHVMGHAARQRSAVESIDAGDPLRLPIAIVVSPAMAQPIRRQCDAVGRQGMLWVPFTEVRTALRWASACPPVVRQKH